MKKINIQQDLDSRREISRMAYFPKTVKETKVEPLTQQTHDKSEEEIWQPADKIHPNEGKKNVRRRTTKENI